MTERATPPATPTSSPASRTPSGKERRPPRPPWERCAGDSAGAQLSSSHGRPPAGLLQPNTVEVGLALEPTTPQDSKIPLSSLSPSSFPSPSLPLSPAHKHATEHNSGSEPLDREPEDLSNPNHTWVYEHIWKRSKEVGNCEVIPVYSKNCINPKPRSDFSSLCEENSSWSTLGGDSRSFVQIVGLSLQQKYMAGRGFPPNRGGFGAGRFGRGTGRTEARVGFSRNGFARGRGGRFGGNFDGEHEFDRDFGQRDQGPPLPDHRVENRGNHQNMNQFNQRYMEEQTEQRGNNSQHQNQNANLRNEIGTGEGGTQMMNDRNENDKRKWVPKENAGDRRQYTGNSSNQSESVNKAQGGGEPMEQRRGPENRMMNRNVNEIRENENEDLLEPWNYTAQYCGSASHGLGFYYIEDSHCEQNTKDMASVAIIKVKQGEVTAKQIETEFRTLAGPGSTWRWYAKKLSENTFQMRFPTVKKVEEMSHFMEMRLRTVPSAVIEIRPWTPGIGSKGKIAEAWFRIRGIPIDKRSIPNVCRVGSLVGLSMQVDKDNLKKFDYVRVKIACRDMTKVPAVVEGLLDFHFYDFFFQRELPQEGTTNPAGNQWVRKDDTTDDKPSPKKPKIDDKAQQAKQNTAQQGASKFSSAPAKLMASAQQAYLKAAPQVKLLEETNEGKGKEKETTVTVEDTDDSDDSPGMGDMVLPGCEALNLGQFDDDNMSSGQPSQEVEFNDNNRKLWHMQCHPDFSMVINEYGTNMYKSKFDPLAAIEAKIAIENAFGSGDVTILNSIMNEQEQAFETQPEVIKEAIQVKATTETNKATSPSPIRDSQEGPMIEISSQKDDKIAEKQMQGGNIEENMAEIEGGKIDEGDAEMGKDNNTNVQSQESEEKVREDTQQKKRQRHKKPDEQIAVRKSSRLEGQYGKVAVRAEELVKKKNLEGLQKDEEGQALTDGASVLQAAAVHYHPRQGNRSTETAGRAIAEA